MVKGSISDYAFGKTASLSQTASADNPMLQKTVGSDPKISDSIAILTYITDEEKIKLMNENPTQWILGLLDVLRISHFATSEKTDIISKLGFFSPRKAVRVIDE